MTTPSIAKKRIYFNEYNLLMGGAAYLPLVSGLLRAYSEDTPEISENYEFMPFIFHIDRKENILDQYKEAPYIAAFSVYMWNEQLCLSVAKEVKRRFPECLIMFGGAQPPHHPVEYFEENPFIDISVRGQGEETFKRLLIALSNGDSLAEIPSISWRDPESGKCVVNEKELEFDKDLDQFPSPYLKGLYDDLMRDRKDLRFQAIMETNRGCPFECTFCYWGMGGLNRKFSFRSIDRVSKELDWCGKNKIAYVFNADSNFGQHKRDMDVVKALVETKKKYGFPEKFRTCYGKNTDDKIFNIARVMYENSLEKGITLSRQSNDDEVLKHIKRGNIKMSTYMNLQRKFNEVNIPVYSELILGLPGESYQTWRTGIEDLLQAGLKNQLFVYLCQVFPNTELADKKYQEEYGVVTQRVPLNEIHCSIHDPNRMEEYEDVIVGLKTMSIEDWKRMVVLSTVTMVLHSLKLGFYLLIYLADRFGVKYTDFIGYISERKMSKELAPILYEETSRFYQHADRIRSGGGRGVEELEYGDIYWDVEEATFLRISKDFDAFYEEMFKVICHFLGKEGIEFDADEVQEAVLYQKSRVPRPSSNPDRELTFSHNFPEYFNKALTDHPVSLVKKPSTIQISQKDFQGDKKMFATEIILWGRKSGRNLTEINTTTEMCEIV
jgi:radical SAM superfamily enzyme YgiQ (UPF0313 family)